MLMIQRESESEHCDSEPGNNSTSPGMPPETGTGVVFQLFSLGQEGEPAGYHGQP